MTHSIKKYWIVIIIIISLIIRFYGLGYEQVSLDESFTLYHAKKSIMRILTLQDPNPPLYLLLVHPLAITGNIYLVRVLSVIFSVLAIPLIYLIGKKLFNEKSGLYSTIILTFSTFHVFYAQEARSYALLNFLVMLSMLFFIKYRDNDKYWIDYLMSTIAMLYTHFFAIFVVIAQNIYLLIEKKKLVRWLMTQILLFIAYIPILLLLFNQLSRVNDNFWIRKGFLIDILHLPYIFSGDILNIIFLALFFYGIWKIYPKDKKSLNNANLLLFWIFVPIIIPLIYSLSVSPIIVPKYVIFTSIPFFIIIGYGLSKIDRRYTSAVLLVIILLSSYFLVNQTIRTDKETWEGISNHIKDIGIEDKVIILNPGYNTLAFIYYYLPECFNKLEIYNCASKKGIFTIWGEEKEKEFINNNRNIIYVNKESNDEKEDVYLEYIKNQFIVYSEEDFPMGKYDHTTVYWLKNEQNN